jgi:hypothetical protein
MLNCGAMKRVLLLGIVFFSGCGYALVGHSNFLDPSIHTIEVPAFVNRTTRVELEQRVTQAVGEELVSRGRLQLVSDPKQAHVVLRGSITATKTRCSGRTTSTVSPRTTK